VAVRLMDDIREISTCQLVFMRYSRERQIRDAVIAVQSLPVLTVGESESLIGCGGIINLAWQNGSVRFEVNQDGARKAGLIISSRLLRLARVHGMAGEN
jgi:YfiR/HmsC-like